MTTITIFGNNTLHCLLITSTLEGTCTLGDIGQWLSPPSRLNTYLFVVGLLSPSPAFVLLSSRSHPSIAKLKPLS